ncbi:hypothetical protein AVEN_222006-1 [Araneus ventricosus]|uniref:Uncharacterized protein n=1 Tax=Araneus ventricosus TaxID=182803 RepID=A0A4Y2TH37_ARAVE|nr:hypothetical protein AVEN_222006-1 [Araneus ventricosus]
MESSKRKSNKQADQVNVFNQHKSHFGLNHASLNHGQMARTPLDHAPPLKSSKPQQRGHLVLMDLACSRFAYAAVAGWNRVSSLNPFSFEAETLSSIHRLRRNVGRRKHY